MALSSAQQKWLEEMKQVERAQEAKRLASLANRTPEEVARDEVTRQIQIETAQRRSRPVPLEKQADPNRIARLNAEEEWDA